MSVQAASDFFNKIYTDDAMRKSLETELGDLSHPDNSEAARRNFGETLAAAGKKNGFEFTADEARDAYKMFLGRFSGNMEGEAELSDAELTGVAGGKAASKPSSISICGGTCS